MDDIPQYVLHTYETLLALSQDNKFFPNKEGKRTCDSDDGRPKSLAAAAVAAALLAASPGGGADPPTLPPIADGAPSI